VSDLQADNSGAPTATGLGNPQTAGRLITINSNAVLSLDSAGGNDLGNGSTVEAVGIIINAGGRLQITAGNATIGPLTLNGGVLAMPSPSGFSTQYPAIELGSTVTVGGTIPSIISNTLDAQIRGMSLGVNTATGQTTFTVASTGNTGVPDLTILAPLLDSGNFTFGNSTRGLIKAGAGILSLSDQNIFHGAININAGELQVNAAETSTTNNGGPLGIGGLVVFGGGALQYSVSNTFDYSARFSTAGGQLYSIDTAGFPVTFATALTSTNGSLTKLGLGTLTLTAAETYAGSTTVSNGTLAVGAGGSLANSTNLSVSAGGTLDVTAVATLTLGSTSALTGSGNATNATILGSVNAGSRPVILNYNGSNPALTMGAGSTLTLNGNAFTVNGSPLTPRVAPYVLIQASVPISGTGPYTATGTALSVINTNVVTVSGNQVLLTITAPTYPTFGTNLLFTISGNSLNFKWPPNYLGSALQSNSLGIIIISNKVATNNWVTIPGSTNVTNLTIPIVTNTNVYYRLQTP